MVREGRRVRVGEGKIMRCEVRMGPTEQRKAGQVSERSEIVMEGLIYCLINIPAAEHLRV